MAPGGFLRSLRSVEMTFFFLGGLRAAGALRAPALVEMTFLFLGGDFSVTPAALCAAGFSRNDTLICGGAATETVAAPFLPYNVWARFSPPPTTTFYHKLVKIFTLFLQ